MLPWLMPTLMALGLASGRDLTVKNLETVNDMVQFTGELFIYMGIISVILLILYNWGYKKRSTIFTSDKYIYKIVIDDISRYSPIEYGISGHLRFKTKKIKPFFHYSYAEFSENRGPHHTFILGAVSRIDNMSIGTHLVSSLEDLINGKGHYSYSSLIVVLGLQTATSAIEIGFVFLDQVRTHVSPIKQLFLVLTNLSRHSRLG